MMQDFCFKRRERLYRQLESRGINTAIIMEPLNICYFSGIRVVPYERFFGLIIDVPKRHCTFVVPSLEKGIACNANIEEIVYLDNEDPVQKVVNYLGDTDVLGVEMDHFSLALGKKIEEHFHSTRIVDITDLIKSFRTIKDNDEIEKLHTAARYGDISLGEIKDFLQVGRSEKEILFQLFGQMTEKPGVVSDQFVIQVLSGEKSANPHGSAGERKLKKGDPVTIDFGVYYANYWSDFCRTFFIGKPDTRMEAIYKVVLEAQRTALEVIKPGIPIKDVDLAARKVIEKAGYGEYFIHRTGHGIGLDIHEFPKIHDKNDDLLEVGMVFTVEPGIYIPKMGGVRIEDDVVVTKEGKEVLNSFPKELTDMIL